MNLTAAFKAAETERWSSLVYPERHRARADRILSITTVFESQQPIVDFLKEGGLKASSINRYLAVLDSVGCDVKYLPVPRSEPRVLSSDELQRLDERVREADNPPCSAVYAILRDTGCRGLVELSRSARSVDWASRTLELVSHKGCGSRRKVPLSSVAERALAWLHHNPPLPSASEWRTFWLRVRLDERNKPYDLRHTFCTRLIDSGLSVAAVSRIMGHGSLNQTMHYYHIQTEHLEHARSALNAGS